MRSTMHKPGVASAIRASLTVSALALSLTLAWGASDLPLDPQLQAKLASVYGHRADLGVLNNAPAMAALRTDELSAVIDKTDGYLPAMAILEAHRRKDLSLHDKIRDHYQKTALEPGEVRFDPHFISQGAATFLATTEYLAATEGSKFLPELLDRTEVWAVPSWFRATFAAVGPGWIKPVIDHANALGPEKSSSVLMSLVAGGASEANLPELHLALQTEQSDAWMAAMEACVRVSNGGCWDLITEEGFKRTPREQLRVALLEIQNQRIHPAAGFATAESAAKTLSQTQVRLERAQLAIELAGFLRIMRASGCPPPPSLALAIRKGGIAPLIREASGN